MQYAYSARSRLITVYFSADVDIVMLLASSLCHGKDRIYLKTEAQDLFLVLGLHVPIRAWLRPQIRDQNLTWGLCLGCTACEKNNEKNRATVSANNDRPNIEGVEAGRTHHDAMHSRSNIDVESPRGRWQGDHFLVDLRLQSSQLQTTVNQPWHLYRSNV